MLFPLAAVVPIICSPHIPTVGARRVVLKDFHPGALVVLVNKISENLNLDFGIKYL